MVDPSIKFVLDNSGPIILKEFLSLWWFWLLLLLVFLGIAVLEGVMKKGKGNKKLSAVIDFFSNTETEKCPECDGVLREKKGKYGRFFGCSNYPKCRYTKPIK